MGGEVRAIESSDDPLSSARREKPAHRIVDVRAPLDNCRGNLECHNWLSVGPASTSSHAEMLGSLAPSSYVTLASPSVRSTAKGDKRDRFLPSPLQDGKEES